LHTTADIGSGAATAAPTVTMASATDYTTAAGTAVSSTELTPEQEEQMRKDLDHSAPPATALQPDDNTEILQSMMQMLTHMQEESRKGQPQQPLIQVGGKHSRQIHWKCRGVTIGTAYLET